MADNNTSVTLLKRSDLFWFYAILGSLFSALATVSLTQKLFHVGLEPVMQEILDYYRGLVHPTMHWLLGWVRWLLPNWQMPEWIRDLYALSFVGGFSAARASVVTQGLGMGRGAAFFVAVVIGVLLGVTGLGLLAFVTLLSYHPRTDDPQSVEAIIAFRLVQLYLTLAVIGSFVFFAINSQL